MPKAKKFIDRKKAVTFNLVHRSQKDPLIADEDAPQRVLVPVNANIPTKKDKEQPKLTPEQKKQEQIKYGIYYDDDYNYLQHLKDTREVCMVVAPPQEHKKSKKKSVKEQTAVDPEAVDKFNLPSSVFASNEEEAVGMLNKAAPQGLCLDLDPDVVAALDEDFNFEDPDNQLEDNFMELAMGEGLEDIEESDSDDSSDQSDVSDGHSSGRAYASDNESGDECDYGRTKRWENEETKSRFSQYSMSSSVVKRNQGLTLLDDRFEKMFADYDDTELGPLDCEDIEGHLPDSNEMLLQAAEEFEQQQKKIMLDKAKEIERIRRLAEIAEESSNEDEMEEVAIDPEAKWDCETILTTYSNLYNHPKVIQEPKRQKIKINAKTGIPVDVLGQQDNRLTIKSLTKFNAINDTSSSYDDDAKSVMSTLTVLSIRPKDETLEEKKERKRLLKEYRKERRLEKKANQEAFKEEKKRQEKIMLNNRKNVQGNRIF